MSVIDTTYHRYLASPEWREKRAERLALDGHCCARCRSADGLEVHHRIYEHLGNEPLADLETLCRRCHMLEHGRDPSLPSQLSDAAVDERWRERMRLELWQETVVIAMKANTGLEILFRETATPPDDPRIGRIRAHLDSIMRDLAGDLGQTWNA